MDVLLSPQSWQNNVEVGNLTWGMRPFAAENNGFSTQSYGRSTSLFDSDGSLLWLGYAVRSLRLQVRKKARQGPLKVPSSPYRASKQQTSNCHWRLSPSDLLVSGRHRRRPNIDRETRESNCGLPDGSFRSDRVMLSPSDRSATLCCAAATASAVRIRVAIELARKMQ